MRYAEGMPCGSPARDRELIQIVDAALADAARKAGDWLACRPGCSQCCIGAFVINSLDAARLRAGLLALTDRDAECASRVRAKSREYMSRLKQQFPGNPESGILDEDPAVQEIVLELADQEACPALDTKTGACDLYEFRPMTCRVFGPPVRNEGGGLGVCELCFRGATVQEIAECEMKPDPDDLEDTLVAELANAGQQGNTIVAFVLAQ